MNRHSSFDPVTDDIITALKKAVGKENVQTDAEALELCASDETEDLAFQPEVVASPETAEGVCRILRIAWENNIPVTPRGGGTGLSGGALPVCGGIVLSTMKLNRILEIDQKNLMAVVEPGVITQEFQEEVEKVGLFYPPDPASRGSCFLGGNLAECAGGPRAVKYGVTKDYVTGVEAVMPDGTLIHHGGKLLKNVTGYNLTQLIIGSEGTLAVITKIYLKLLPLPRYRQTLLIPFASLEASAQTVPAIMNAGIVPSALELMERDAVKMAEKHLSTTFPSSDAAAHLLIEIDGNDISTIEKASEQVCEIALKEGATDVLLADTSAKQQELWDLRRALGEAVKSVSIYKEEDTVVPRYNLVPLLLGVKEISKRYGITTVCYGHAGDGNLHVNILKMDMSETEWTDNLDPAIEEIFKLTVSLGGMISGEHGIGYVQRKYLPLAISETELDLMKRLKQVFDKKGILNPSKIFP
ncbi:MAG: FAD-binding protein [Candidatus Latescibacteria bacterium]|nr:FAD-binding protein [Candidatus Latescibacterota bacterium]NIM21399.1 FAD-binding protein [Candidatus Latescibacterota bacterium]NIM65580.1 FAD-binding protein [Candidatus Latescibacterota bacterium]NIO01960.1 FAD-binding protein [Candidatus Latescibacterota bacterium]NIO28773.1 FAD-binding protein [Candidatus Latescibacterota bacterium]